MVADRCQFGSEQTISCPAGVIGQLFEAPAWLLTLCCFGFSFTANYILFMFGLLSCAARCQWKDPEGLCQSNSVLIHVGASMCFLASLETRDAHQVYGQN